MSVMKSSDAVVTASPFAVSQATRRAKSSRCFRRVTGRQVLPKVAVYSAMSGRRGRAGRSSRPARRRRSTASESGSTPPSDRVSMTLYYIRPTLPATILGGSIVPPADDEFRARLRDVLTRSGLSMRALSAVLGRDPGYVAALLDPSRPSRARPTPADLLRASDATGIPFVELLEALWGIERSRLADGLARLGVGDPQAGGVGGLTEAERTEVGEFAAFLASRHPKRVRERLPRGE